MGTHQVKTSGGKGCKKRRNKPKYARYKALRKHERSHIRRLRRHVTTFPNDAQAKIALKAYEARLLTAPR